LQIKTKIVSCHTADSKLVKQEVNGTVILSPLVFPGWAYVVGLLWLDSSSSAVVAGPLWLGQSSWAVVAGVEAGPLWLGHCGLAVIVGLFWLGCCSWAVLAEVLWLGLW
jgi:hypothetical protein